jgi:hypothetical protein
MKNERAHFPGKLMFARHHPSVAATRLEITPNALPRAPECHACFSNNYLFSKISCYPNSLTPLCTI